MCPEVVSLSTGRLGIQRTLGSKEHCFLRMRLPRRCAPTKKLLSFFLLEPRFCGVGLLAMTLVCRQWRTLGSKYHCLGRGSRLGSH